MHKLLSILFVTIASILMSCGTVKSTAFMDYHTQYIGSELDGSITVRSFGKARNALDSYEQAQKQAVYDIVFTEIHKKDGSTIKPLLLEINAKEKYEDYFNAFFKDDGEYKNYCSMKEKRYLSSRWARTNAQSVCETTVCVYRNTLKEKLIKDGIIIKQD